MEEQPDGDDDVSRETEVIDVDGFTLPPQPRPPTFDELPPEVRPSMRTRRNLANRRRMIG